MSRVVIRLVRWFATALLALSIVLLGSAESKADPKSDDTTDAKLKVVSKKGRTKGNYSVLSRKSKPGSENDGQWKGANRSENRIPNGDQESIAAWCWAQTEDTSCLVTGPSDVATLLTGPLARAMAVNLVVQLRFPAPKPIFGPDPAKNEWKMLAVGFPVWLWTQGPTTVSTSMSSNGFTFLMTARWRSTTFHMGDGNSVTCTAMTKYSASVKPGTASPNCGYVYAKPSLPKGKYQVRAVADWDVAWSVAGFSGVIPAYNEASSSIPIGELSALNR